MVVHRDNVVFVANGRGGLSILTMNYDPTPPDPEPNTCQGTPENLVVNGGFEEPNVGKSWTFVPKLTCWTIVKPVGKAELDTVSTWDPAEGVQSLDLDPDAPGEIYQELVTEPGKAYNLNFELAGNITKRNIKKVEVFWGEHSLGELTFDATDKSKRNMGWESISIDIPGDKTDSDRTKLRFVSRMESGSTGPVLDDVRVRLADDSSNDPQ